MAEETVTFPCFSDFSPELLKQDIQRVFRDIASGGTPEDWINTWNKRYFSTRSDANTTKKSAKNVRITIADLGLLVGNPPMLSSVGKEIADAVNPTEALRIFLRHVLVKRNGLILIDTLKSLNKRGIDLRRGVKERLQNELEDKNVKLPSATTYHTTLLNWLVLAELVEPRAKNFLPRDAELKALLGVDATESSELASLPEIQRVFLEALRRHIDFDNKPISSTQLVNEIAHTRKKLVDRDQIRKKIINPLVERGWILSTDTFAKAAFVTATEKLIAIPLWAIERGFDESVPADLKPHLDISLKQISEMYRSEDTFRKGLGLELLALRMIRDLGLTPRAFRERTNTGGGEVDILAEGAHLVFSRWTIQCKNTTSNVRHKDIAKEVGMAMQSKAHVVMVVSQADFTANAREMAQDIAEATHLQFLLVPGTVVEDYLAHGYEKLLDFVLTAARETMRHKRSQADKAISEPD